MARPARIEYYFKKMSLSLLLVVTILFAACANPKTLCRTDGVILSKAKRETLKKELYRQNDKYGREEPIFHLRTPILFAHRGGVLVQPESTSKAFNHALNEAHADVLELDIQLTRDGEFVVWHGPILDKVKIKDDPWDNIPNNRPRDKSRIDHYYWKELEGKAWVAEPAEIENQEEINLSGVEEKSDKLLLSLKEFLNEYPDVPLNIEMKSSFLNNIENNDKRNGLKDNIYEFLLLLDEDRKRPRKEGVNRNVVVASRQHKILKEFRKQAGDRYPTNLSQWEAIKLLFSRKGLENRAVETPYPRLFSGERIANKVREEKGATFPFLTKFFIFPGLDNNPCEEKIFKILDRGVDGIMTDQPECIRKIMDKWLKKALRVIKKNRLKKKD